MNTQPTTAPGMVPSGAAVPGPTMPGPTMAGSTMAGSTMPAFSFERVQPYLVPAVIAWLVATLGVNTSYPGWLAFRYAGEIGYGYPYGIGPFWIDPILVRFAHLVLLVGLVAPVLVAVRRPLLATGLATAVLVVPALLLGSWLVAAYLAFLGVIYVVARGSALAGLAPLTALAGSLLLLISWGAGNLFAGYANHVEYYDYGRRAGTAILFVLGGLAGYGLGVAAGAYRQRRRAAALAQPAEPAGPIEPVRSPGAADPEHRPATGE